MKQLLGRIPYHQVFHFISASITLVDIHLNWLNWCHFHILTGSPLLILIDCMIFLSSYLNVTRMTISTVFFLLQLGSAILYLQNVFFTCDLNNHKFRVNGTLLFLGSDKQLYCMLLISFFFFM